MEFFMSDEAAVLEGDLGTFSIDAPENNAANVLPKGEYPVCLVKSEVKFNKDLKTQVLHCEFQILPPHEFANRKIFQQIPFRTTSTEEGKITWVRIGATKLSSLARACLGRDPKNSRELWNKPVIAVVKISEATANFDASNEITKFKARSASLGMNPPPPVDPPAGANPPANTNGEPNPFG